MSELASHGATPSDSPQQPEVRFMPHVKAADLNDKQKGFVTSVRHLEATNMVHGDSLLRMFADIFPSADLFSKELCDLPAIYTELCNFLDAHGANMQQHSSRRIMMTLAHNVYEEQEDWQAAIGIVSEIMTAGRRMRPDLSQTENSRRSDSQAPASPSSTSAASAPDRVAHNVSMRLRDGDKTFSGALGESWMEFFDEYIHVCRDYALSPTQKLQYMHNLLSGDAKRFYLDRVDGYATSYQQAIDLIEKEYNWPVQ